jgi:DNA-binding response OmpR family regulator
MRILLIARHFQELKCTMEKAGCDVYTAEDTEAAEQKVRSVDDGIIILDQASLDNGDLAPVKEWRRRGVCAHILILAARLTLEHKVNIFDAGADGYVLKPNHQEELLARIRAIMRRHHHQVKETMLRIFDLEIDPACRAVKRAGKTIRLSRREYDVLQYLALRRGKTVSRSMILSDLYGLHSAAKSNIINVYISYLRFKIDDGFELPLILTIRGKGYMLRGVADKKEAASPLAVESATLHRAQASSSPAIQKNPIVDHQYQFAT